MNESEKNMSPFPFQNNNEIVPAATEERAEKREIEPAVEEVIKANPKLHEAVKLYKDKCDEYTVGHVFGTTNKSELISDYLDLNEENKKFFIQAALLHDIGKADEKIAELIKDKRNDLSDEEKDTIRGHVRGSIEYAKEIEMPDKVLQIIGAHHEENNGKSYPRKEERRKDSDTYTGEERREEENRTEPTEEIKKIIHAFSIIDRLDAIYHKRSYSNECSAKECYEKLIGEFPSEEDHKIIDLLLTEEGLKEKS